MERCSIVRRESAQIIAPQLRRVLEVSKRPTFAVGEWFIRFVIYSQFGQHNYRKLLYVANVLLVVKCVGEFNCGGRGDVVEIDSWVAAEGKNGMRRDFLVRDYTTGEVIARATRCVMIWD